MKSTPVFLSLACRVALMWGVCILAACSTARVATAPHTPVAATQVTLPVATAWHEGMLVHYISLDTSDAAMAKAKNMNFVPRLALALGEGTAPQSRRSVLERVYLFPDESQLNVFPSVPQPVGFASTDTAYSPLWQVYAVTWQPGQARRELRSEEQVLEATERGDVSLTATRIVTNCPVLKTERGGVLPGAQFSVSPG